MRAAPDLIVGQQSEEALDLVDSGRRGGREVRMPASAPSKPAPDQLGLVARCVVHHDMHVEVGRNVLLDHGEEAPTLGGGAARHALAENGSCLDVEVATVTRVVSSRSAIATLLTPSAASNTISARMASARATFRRRSRDTSSVASAPDNSIVTAFGVATPPPPVPQEFNESRQHRGG